MRPKRSAEDACQGTSVIMQDWLLGSYTPDTSLEPYPAPPPARACVERFVTCCRPPPAQRCCRLFRYLHLREWVRGATSAGGGIGAPPPPRSKAGLEKGLP